MQVIQSEFSQSGVLIGQQQATQSFGVSDDPMLMSMLSTGFYGNPLRTCIQEVMCNSWDAHHIGDCTDRAIEITLTDKAISFRDYGPGISPSDMHPIYCIYGNSTKRNDKRQTGGFGLGSKSPFAKTETFTVISHHKGTKVMYHITRSSDANGGKPGLTPLVEVPTEETGLLVTIPLDPGDMVDAKKYVYELLYLSGIKAKISIDGSDWNELASRKLDAGEYWMSERKLDADQIYAVYGGVKYKIPKDKLYNKELEFLSLIASVGSLYIGFAPDSLSPLPNREGLNMNQKTKENVQAGLERAMDRFQQVFEPLVQALVWENMDHLKDLEPQFALFRALGLVSEGPSLQMAEFIKKMKPLAPYGSDPRVWSIGLSLLQYRLGKMVDAIGEEKWAKMTLSHFTRVFPNHRHLAFALRKTSDLKNLSTSRYGYSKNVLEPLTELLVPEFCRTHFKLEQELKALLGEKGARSVSPLRLKGTSYNDTRWQVMLRERSKLRDPSETEKKLGIQRRETKPVIDRMWSKNGNPLKQLMAMRTIILAKTASALQETSLKPVQYLNSEAWGNESIFIGGGGFLPVAGYVIHEAHGAYTTALKFFHEKGFKVIEAPEPNRKVYVRKSDQPKPKVPTYPLVAPGCPDWVMPEDSIQPRTTETPSHFIYATPTAVNSYRQSILPNRELIRKMKTIYPDIVICHSMNQSQSLEKKGVKPFQKALEEWYENQTTNKYRFRNIVRAMTVESKAEISNRIIRESPEIQKMLHMVPVDPKDTEFWADVDFYKSLSGSSWSDIRALRQKIAKEITEVRDTDPVADKIVSVCKTTRFLSNYEIQREWERMASEKRPDFAKKIVRMIRAL